MLIKVLGALDLLVAIVLFLLALSISIPIWLLIILVVALAVKSVPFVIKLDIASIIDVLVAIVLVFAIFSTGNALIFVLAALAIGQKGVFSLL